MSAHKEEDLIRLKEKIVKIIKEDYELVEMSIPFEDGKV